MSFPEEEQPQSSQPASSEEQPNPVEPAPAEIPPADQVVYPEETVLPAGFTPLGTTSGVPRARRRRARRTLGMPGVNERATILDGLARRAFPSIEFFVFALLGGAVLGAAYLMDSPALLLLGILLAPLLTPWVGLILAIQTGSWRFFFQTLFGLLVACLLVFLTGVLAGWAGHLWLPLPFTRAIYHSHLWWPDLFLVALGAILLTVSFVRSEHRPVLPSLMLAYGFFVPLSAGGVGLGININSLGLAAGMNIPANLWPDGAEVFLVHLALASFLGILTLAFLHFKPAKAGGYFLSVIMSLVCLAALVNLTGLTRLIRDEILVTRQTVPTPTMTVAPSDTPTDLPTPTQTNTALPTDTLQPTSTLLPTPAYAIIAASVGGGARVRSDPGSGTALAVLINGTLVQVLPEIQSVDGVSWVHIRWNNLDGWILTSVLMATTETPLPPTLTLTPTP
jgi:hypothetical protein